MTQVVASEGRVVELEGNSRGIGLGRGWTARRHKANLPPLPRVDLGKGELGLWALRRGGLTRQALWKILRGCLLIFVELLPSQLHIVE